MGKRFFPRKDAEFAEMARVFAANIAGNLAWFHVSQADSDALTAAVKEFAQRSFDARRRHNNGIYNTQRKRELRRELERTISRMAVRIRTNDAVPPVAKAMLKLEDQPRKRAAPQPMPLAAPKLRFVRARHEGGAVPVHELEFSVPLTNSRSRPSWAARIELFVDLVSPDEPIPKHPGANQGGRPWYLRSYRRNPIVLVPPIAREPMRVVYWARWADAAGEVGPFSATAVGWVEGGAHLPALAFGAEPLKLVDPVAADREGRDATIFVTVLDARYAQINGMHAMPSLPEPPSERPAEPRQLEGPRDENQAQAA